MTNGNGHDPDHKEKKKVVKFPTLAERDRIRKKQEDGWRGEYKAAKKQNAEPFFNFGAIPPVTKTLVALFVGIQIILSVFINDIQNFNIIYRFGFIPGAYTGSHEWQWTALITPLTYNFIHSDWTHLGFNAIMTLALGTFVERMFSSPTTIKFFLICGIAGALAYFALNPLINAPVIGASGSVSGLFAAAIMMMYEQDRFGALTGKLANKGPWPLIFIWAGIMIFIGLIGGGVAWEAHIGGLFAGAGLYTLMRKGKLRL